MLHHLTYIHPSLLDSEDNIENSYFVTFKLKIPDFLSIIPLYQWGIMPYYPPVANVFELS